MNTDARRGIHHGHNVRFFRELRRIKQDVLADAVGISQATLSRLESQEKIDDETLEKIAKELSTSVETFKTFDGEKVINIISNNTFHDEASANGYISQYKSTFNPLDKIEELYERLLEEKDDQIKLFERLLKIKDDSSI